MYVALKGMPRSRTLGSYRKAVRSYRGLSGLGDNSSPISYWTALEQEPSLYWKALVNQPWYYSIIPGLGPTAAVAEMATSYTPPPGSDATSVAANLISGGQPTDAQIAVNTNACIAANAAMRAQGYSVPASADQQCVTDQKNFVNSIGGTANQILTSLAPSNPLIWIALAAGIIGVFVYLKK
jgi:hypothetical protein